MGFEIPSNLSRSLTRRASRTLIFQRRGWFLHGQPSDRPRDPSRLHLPSPALGMKGCHCSPRSGWTQPSSSGLMGWWDGAIWAGETHRATESSCQRKFLLRGKKLLDLTTWEQRLRAVTGVCHTHTPMPLRMTPERVPDGNKAHSGARFSSDKSSEPLHSLSDGSFSTAHLQAKPESSSRGWKRTEPVGSRDRLSVGHQMNPDIPPSPPSSLSDAVRESLLGEKQAQGCLWCVCW